jgi:pyrimidine-nucleoside phosphorylase
MHMVDIIAKKRDGHTLDTAEIQWFIEQYTADNIPDYQAAALCMAIYLRGMSRRETVDLTLAMVASGDTLDLHDVIPFSVDKHSSGGVGDKTTLVVQPLVAACGVPVAKMSGRGLGFTGGTLDKMESISGWSCTMSLAQFKQQVADIGLVLAGQTADFAPADGKLYALRDVTATVASIPLIAASIMSKKLAAGADGIVLDVKVGSGAFMRTVKEARTLSELMVQIGQDAGRNTTALLSDMNQPLGYAIGNALEVKEAIATLHSGDDDLVPADFWTHCLEVAAHMLLVANKATNLDEAKAKITAVRDDGSGWEKFRQMVQAQGGDVADVDNPERLPRARIVEPLVAKRTGYIAAIDTGAIGLACTHLGAGREQKGDPLDPAVGLIMPVKVGANVQAGEVICWVHANDESKLQEAATAVRQAIQFTADPVLPPKHFHGTIQ